MALALALEGPATGPEEEGVVGEAARISGGKRAARALMPAVMASRLLRSTSLWLSFLDCSHSSALIASRSSLLALPRPRVPVAVAVRRRGAAVVVEEEGSGGGMGRASSSSSWSS